MKKRFWKILAIICSVVTVASILGGVAYVSGVVNSAEYVNFDKNKLNEVYTSLTILDTNGKVLEEPLSVNGRQQIPLDALPEHVYMAFVAVEDKRFFQHDGIDARRVLGAFVHNVKSGRYKEGASTISQQLIKNTHLNNGKNFKRKINEMLLARELEKAYSKREILEMYLNTIYFGRNAYGIETAANVYFNKSAKDLTVSESAALAGMVKAPNTYAPDKNLDKCRERRNTVLKLMTEQNIITQEECATAQNSEIAYSADKKGRRNSYSNEVMKEACRLLNMTPLQLAKSDFVIETYCKQDEQKALNELANNDELAVKGNADLSCLLCDNKGGVEACFFNSSSEAKRQVGSVLKPIAVYAPALNERIITQASPVLDEETDFNGYKPANAGSYNGWTTIKNAVAKSLNVPAVKTLNALGLTKSQQYLEKFGITGEQNLSLALGNANGGLNITALAKCYAALANDGCCNDVAYIKSIYNENGLIYNRNLQDKRIFQAGANYLMTDLLINTAKAGTARRLADLPYQVAAKTGTVGNSKGNTDALLASYTSLNTCIVWYSGQFGNDVNGATAPTEFTRKLYEAIYKENTPDNFTKPDGVCELVLDKDELYNNQLQVIAQDGGEVFLFENGNKPKQTAHKTCYDYVLDVETCGSTVKITLPTDDEWTLYSKIGKTVTKLTHKNGEYSETIKDGAQYYAELFKCGKVVYTTPKVEVCKSDEEQKNDGLLPPSILDYWYW